MRFAPKFQILLFLVVTSSYSSIFTESALMTVAMEITDSSPKQQQQQQQESLQLEVAKFIEKNLPKELDVKSSSVLNKGKAEKKEEVEVNFYIYVAQTNNSIDDGNSNSDGTVSTTSEAMINLETILNGSTATNKERSYGTGNKQGQLRRFNASWATVLVTHGHGGSLNDMSIVTIRRAYEELRLSNADGRGGGGELNVIAVEWSKYAGLFYPLAIMYVKEVGAKVAKMLDELVRLGSDPDSITLIGHSLGAHVMGSAGKQATRKPGRIVGLDPAGPLIGSGDVRIGKGDAKVVEIVHTCGSFFGLHDPLGHVDFYPNGGLYQVGCETEYPRCDHLRAYHLYAEAIARKPDPESSSSPPLVGIKCPSYDHFLKDDCKNTQTLPMNFDARKYKAGQLVEGSFYLRTNHQQPFGMGLKGIRP